MGKIDSLIKHLYEFKAEGLGIRSDRRVVLFNGPEQQPITAQPLAAAHVELLLGGDSSPLGQLGKIGLELGGSVVFGLLGGGVMVLLLRRAGSAGPSPPPC